MSRPHIARTRRERAQKRRELKRRVEYLVSHYQHKTAADFPTAHCVRCYEGFIIEAPYHEMGLCHCCARLAGAAWIKKHTGECDDRLDPEGAAREAAAKRAEREKKYSKGKIGSSVRLKVFERDDYKCRHCGTSKELRVDHVHPERLGGTLALDNLQTLCARCNSKKGWRPQKAITA